MSGSFGTGMIKEMICLFLQDHEHATFDDILGAYIFLFKRFMVTLFSVYQMTSLR